MRTILILLFAMAAWGQNPNTAAFPTRVVTDQDISVAKRISQSTLSASINSSTLTVNVASGAQFLQYEIVRIDSEEMLICTIASNTLTICTGARGYNGTTAASHTSGATAYGVITSWPQNQMAAEIKAIETRLSTRVAQCQDAGATDAYACSVSPSISSYSTGLLVNFKANTANTGASTLNLNSIGAVALKKWASATLSDTATGDIGAGQWFTAVYDGTYFQIIGGGGGIGDVTTSGPNTMTGYTDFSGATFRFPETTAASLPSAASNTGKIFVVTDSLTGFTCTSGSGANKVICRSDGSSWVLLNPMAKAGIGNGISINCSSGLCTVTLRMDEFGLAVRCEASSSSPTTYTCTPSNAFSVYYDGTLAIFDVGSTACTGSTATTLNISGVGAKRIYRYDGTSDPQAADCTAGANLILIYDSSLTGGAGGWRIIGGTPGSGTSGTAVDPYTTTFSSVTSVSVTAATHGQGTNPMVACFDNATPKHLFGCDVSAAANGDVVVTFTSSLSGTLLIYGGGGSGNVRADATFGTNEAVIVADGTSRGAKASTCTISSGALTCSSIGATGGGLGILTLTEGTAPGAGASAGQVNIYVDSSTHRLGFHINGGSSDKILQSSSLAADFPTLNQNTTGNAATATSIPADVTTFTSVTSVSRTAAQHGKGTDPMARCYDNGTPAHEFACDVSVAANGDVVVTFSKSVSGSLKIW